jgi:hypothetical protein
MRTSSPKVAHGPGPIDHPDHVVDGPFRGSAAVRAGLVTEAMLRGPRYQRVFPDIYAPVDLPLDLVPRSRAAYLWLADRGVLAGYSAAAIYAAPCAPLDAPAEVITPSRHRHAPPGMIVRQDSLADDEHRLYRGVRLTTPLRTAYDLARRLGTVDAVVALDALAGRFGFKPDELLTLSARYPRARGRRGIPKIVMLAEPLAGSPMETRLRLLLEWAGLPRPAVEYGIPDRRAHIVAHVDLAYPDQHIAIEYESEEHFTRERGMRDVYRYTRLQDLGWRVYRYRARDILGEPDRVVAELRRALRGAA